MLQDWLYNNIEKFCRFFQTTIGTPSSKRLHSVFFGGVLASLYCLLQFLSSPLFGALSDVFGRKYILLISISGTLLSYIIWANANTFTLFVLSRIIGGFSKASVSICIAAMADVYSQNNVGQGMAVIGGSFSIGFLIGPIFGVYFSRSTNRGSELIISAVAKFDIILTIMEFAFVALILPETLEISKRKTLARHVWNNCMSYIKPKALFQFSVVKNRLNKTGIKKMQLYGRAYFLYIFLYSGLEFTLSFLTHTRYSYDSMQQGRMYFFIGALMIITQGGIVRRIPVHKQHTAIIYGVLFTVCAYIIIGYSTRIEVFYFGLALYAIASSLVVPCMTTCTSNLAPSDVKGATIGVFRSLGALARALAPLFASTVFWLHGPTVCYSIGGCLLILPIVILRQVSSEAR
ncbi:unnamed protein product [Thelazia callipaeda]|uniref:MFS domain-containing protein n=1 Tax=Thelazia callipaeda TaxID=103827 RepID=A0A0N5D0V5_THECL|nr:unnamed protein product [Thelazia callipaeda]